MRPNRRVPVTFAVATLLAGVAAPARAAEGAAIGSTSTSSPTATAIPASTSIPTSTPTATPTPAASPATNPAVAPGVSLPRDLEVEVHGRIYMGMVADARDDWSRELGLRQARIEVEARLGRARTVLEADLASREPIKDAYLRLDGPLATRFTAGRFKAPFSERQLTSSWRLPLVARGLVDDYVVEVNALGGRRLGATGALRPWDGRVELAAGVFSSDPTDRNDGTAEDVAARAAARPWKALEVGASAYRAAASSGPRREAAAVHLRLEAWAVEAVLEGMTGTLAQGPFTAGTALASVTVRLLSGRLRVAPVAGAEVLELREGPVARGHAVIGGAVISWLDGLKLKVQGERARRPGDDVPQNALAIELGTRF